MINKKKTVGFLPAVFLSLNCRMKIAKCPTFSTLKNYQIIYFKIKMFGYITNYLYLCTRKIKYID